MSWILSKNQGKFDIANPFAQGTLNSSMVQAEYPKMCGPAPTGAVIPGEEIHLWKFCDIYLSVINHLSSFRIYHLSSVN